MRPYGILFQLPCAAFMDAADGFSHGLTNSPPDCLFPSLRSGPAFRIPLSPPIKKPPAGGFFLIPCARLPIGCNPHPYGTRLAADGFSHGLTNSPPDCLFPSLRSGPAFRIPLSPPIKKPPAGGFFIGGESGIRTHGALPHHQFSRLAP